MKKYILLMMLAVAAFVGCKKEETNSTTAPCQKGTLQLVNKSEFAYDFEVDNKQIGQVAGKKNIDHSLSNGTYLVKIIQFNGFAVNPAVHEHYITIKGCETSIIEIPKTAAEPE